MGYRVRLFVLLVATVLLAPVAVTAQVATPVPAIPASFGYRVVNEYPHDRHAFTEGLAYVDGVLYEGTGLYGESTLRRVDLQTGEVLQTVGLSKEYPGCGSRYRVSPRRPSSQVQPSSSGGVMPACVSAVLIWVRCSVAWLMACTRKSAAGISNDSPRQMTRKAGLPSIVSA